MPLTRRIYFHTGPATGTIADKLQEMRAATAAALDYDTPPIDPFVAAANPEQSMREAEMWHRDSPLRTSPTVRSPVVLPSTYAFQTSPYGAHRSTNGRKTLLTYRGPTIIDDMDTVERAIERYAQLAD